MQAFIAINPYRTQCHIDYEANRPGSIYDANRFYKAKVFHDNFIEKYLNWPILCGTEFKIGFVNYECLRFDQHHLRLFVKEDDSALIRVRVPGEWEFEYYCDDPIPREVGAEMIEKFLFMDFSWMKDYDFYQYRVSK